MQLRGAHWTQFGASYLCKCFTYVTKTCANLTTYSRKPENYNGTIIFEIDIMKNSSPINLKLDFSTNYLAVSFVLIYWLYSEAELRVL